MLLTSFVSVLKVREFIRRGPTDRPILPGMARHLARVGNGLVRGRMRQSGPGNLMRPPACLGQQIALRTGLSARVCVCKWRIPGIQPYKDVRGTRISFRSGVPSPLLCVKKFTPLDLAAPTMLQREHSQHMLIDHWNVHKEGDGAPSEQNIESGLPLWVPYATRKMAVANTVGGIKRNREQPRETKQKNQHCFAAWQIT
eukprot:gene7727-biopygen4578